MDSSMTGVEIKFQYLYRGPAFSSKNHDFNWHEKVYTLAQLVEKSLAELCDVHASSELVAARQFTGKKDVAGKEIFYGDIVRCSLCSELKMVDWCVESCCFVMRHLPNHPYSENYFMDEGEIEVLGNLWRNPELQEAV